MSNLDPSNWRILNTVNLGKSTLVLAECLKQPEACPHCGVVRPVWQAYGKRKIRLVDLPQSGKPVLVVAQRQRFHCLACNRTWLQPMSDVDEKHRLFKRAVDYILQQALHRTHSSIARALGIDTKTVYNIVADWVKQMEKIYGPSAPRVLGIDEIKLLGQRRCVFIDLDSGRVLDLLETRTREGVQKWFSRLHRPHRIEVASVAPWNGYRVSIQKALPRTELLVDKAHVLGLATRCLDHFCQLYTRTLSPPERRRIARHKRLLLRSEKELQLEDAQMRDSWLGQFPSLERAYRLKEHFSTVYEASSRQEAQARFVAWKASIPAELRHAFKPLTSAMRLWEVEVFNYFDHRPREFHRFSELAARLIAKVVKSGRGYGFQILRAKLIYSHPPTHS